VTTITRYDDHGSPRVGLVDDGRLWPLALPTIAEALELPLAELRGVVAAALRGPSHDAGSVHLLPPVDGRTEVWASGVTYARSRDARREESAVQDVYAHVYEAERPELFFKCAAWRVVPDGGALNIRSDSALNVPEPELVLVVNAHAEIAGYAVGNDMSSRSIEGLNPLYLPQAKIYDGAFALSSGIRPAWELEDGPLDLAIEMDIVRDGSVAWRGTTSTKHIVRNLTDLVEHLFRCYTLPQGALLSTGTGIVPQLDVTTVPGDEVRIRIAGVGDLTNPIGMTGPPVSHSLITTTLERTD